MNNSNKASTRQRIENDKFNLKNLKKKKKHFQNSVNIVHKIKCKKKKRNEIIVKEKMKREVIIAKTHKFRRPTGTN